MNSELPAAKDSVSYDVETDTYRATYDTTNIMPSTAIIEMMATILEREATDIVPLAEVIDPEALDQFLLTQSDRPHGRDRSVEFTFEGHELTVLSYGIIKVHPIATKD